MSAKFVKNVFTSLLKMSLWFSGTSLESGFFLCIRKRCV